METNLELPAYVESSLQLFTQSIQEAFGKSLISVMLFGSAAEGRLRQTSDVNVLVVLRDFQKEKADGLHGAYAMAHSAVRLNVMFLLEGELSLDSEAFAVKFSDIGVRHKVVFGEDLFTNLRPSREGVKRRLKQVLANLILRLRERYVLEGPAGKKLASVIAEISGPLRACALSIAQLEGRKTIHPKEALAEILPILKTPGYEETLKRISEAREGTALDAPETVKTIFSILEIAEKMAGYVEKIK